MDATATLTAGSESGSTSCAAPAALTGPSKSLLSLNSFPTRLDEISHFLVSGILGSAACSLGCLSACLLADSGSASQSENLHKLLEHKVL